jgi:predicted Zn-dependent protease with MMP-like domain
MDRTQDDPDLPAFQAMARQSLDSLPPRIARAARDVVILVVDWPPDEVLESFGIEDRLELTGLYDGIPLTEKSLADQPLGPDMIWLYREPILDEWRARGDVDIEDLVTHVLIHELAHHFGWSDDDIAMIDPWWE